MSLVVLPPPPTPNLTVRSLAKLMVRPASALPSEVRDHKYPRGGSGAHRVPYYQVATSALRRLLRAGGDVSILAAEVVKLEAQLREVVDDDDASTQAEARLRNNLRVLEAASDFPRLRDATAAQVGRTQKAEFEGFEIRSTPELDVQFPVGSKFVFLHRKADALDDDEARRTLELAHWVARESGHRSVKMSDFEYWDFGARTVHRWSRARKTTVKKALDTLPVIWGVWQAAEPPVHWEADRRADAVVDEP